MVHYYQQVGRALDEAYGILLGGKEDKEITDYFIRTAFPPQAHIDVVIEALNQVDDAKRGESESGCHQQNPQVSCCGSHVSSD